MLGLALDSRTSIFAQNRFELLSSGTFAACVKSCGRIGYQHEFPIFWFSLSLYSRNERIKLQPLKIPLGDEQVWPNQRGLLFLDFHVLPRQLPQDIETTNKKVSPSIQLKFDQFGVISRELLPDAAAEKFLRWRIYHNGKLIETAPATSMKNYSCRQGVGNYVAWVGVEGKNGFMPVSNLVKFPLFPSADGKLVVLPDFKKGSAPSCVQEALERLQARANVGAGQQSSIGPEAPSLRPPLQKPSADSSDQLLVDLWKEWKWCFQYHVQGPITLIPTLFPFKSATD